MKKKRASTVHQTAVKVAEREQVRTNIIMEEPLVAEAQAITGILTKSGVVHYALREVVRRARQKELLKLQGKIAWEGDLEVIRRTRPL